MSASLTRWMKAVAVLVLLMASMAAPILAQQPEVGVVLRREGVLQPLLVRQVDHHAEEHSGRDSK